MKKWIYYKKDTMEIAFYSDTDKNEVDDTFDKKQINISKQDIANLSKPLIKIFDGTKIVFEELPENKKRIELIDNASTINEVKDVLKKIVLKEI